MDSQNSYSSVPNNSLVSPMMVPNNSMVSPMAVPNNSMATNSSLANLPPSSVLGLTSEDVTSGLRQVVLYNCFMNPPSAGGNAKDLFNNLDPTGSGQIAWKSVTELLMPYDVPAWGPRYNPTDNLTYPQFAEFVEAVSEMRKHEGREVPSIG